eukprot:TRINITY_DN8003_c0_g1_i1.p2 TRINITY_DN8003_c0_g1~~TRINITY_DN8003_c0_g1_i1.p2  ORF type:complete len:620 (-),score=102.71 TRINITY_DN8003_c0_g1_i1:48-1907(-)
MSQPVSSRLKKFPFRKSIKKEKSLEKRAIKKEDKKKKKRIEKVFETDLSLLVSDEEPIPSCVREMLDHLALAIESGEAQGIFVTKFHGVELLSLKQKYNEDGTVDLQAQSDPVTTSNLLKLFLTDLPEPLLLNEVKTQLFKILTRYGTTESALQRMRIQIRKLPMVNYNILDQLVEIVLYAMSDSRNDLDPRNVSDVLGPCLFHAYERPDSDTAKEILRIMLLEYSMLFGESDEPKSEKFQQIYFQQSDYSMTYDDYGFAPKGEDLKNLVLDVSTFLVRSSVNILFDPVLSGSMENYYLDNFDWTTRKMISLYKQHKISTQKSSRRRMTPTKDNMKPLVSEPGSRKIAVPLKRKDSLERLRSQEHNNPNQNISSSDSAITDVRPNTSRDIPKVKEVMIEIPLTSRVPMADRLRKSFDIRKKSKSKEPHVVFPQTPTLLALTAPDTRRSHFADEVSSVESEGGTTPRFDKKPKLVVTPVESRIEPRLGPPKRRNTPSKLVPNTSSKITPKKSVDFEDPRNNKETLTVANKEESPATPLSKPQLEGKMFEGNAKGKDQNFVQLLNEYKALYRFLSEYQENFKQKYGREVKFNKDRIPVQKEYARYKEIKIKLQEMRDENDK